MKFVVYSSAVLLLHSVICYQAHAFSPSHSSLQRAAKREGRLVLFQNANNNIDNNHNNNNNEVSDRRHVLKTVAATTALGWFANAQNAFADEADVPLPVITTTTTSTTNSETTATNPVLPMGSSPENPIVVLGAGGKVGKLCTQMLSDMGLYVCAVTRSGRQVLDSSNSQFVTYASADVTNLSTLQSALQGASGVIFAASASGKKKGGDPAHVDYLGLYNTALACLEASVPKLAVVSAATVTRPDSIGFKATNAFVKFVYGERIMDYKIAGEALVRDLYSKDPTNKCAYCIIRPGGLNDKSSVGSQLVHVSQGDVYAGEIPRADVAAVTVAALLKGSATDNITFEVSGVEGIAKTLSSLPNAPPALVHAGAPTFDNLLDGLLNDKDIKATYPDLINDFTGDGIVPLASLA